MWLVEDLEVQSVRLDFTSSAGGRPQSRAVVAHGVVLVNAVDYVDFSANLIQVHVCEQCGTVGCASGGYVCLRRVGDFCVWLPAYDAMLDTDGKSHQFAPPGYVEAQGIPLLQRATYAKLRSEAKQLPAFADLLLLSALDAARTVQWEAPLHALGTPPNALGTPHTRPAVSEPLVLAVSEGDVRREIERLNATLDAFIACADRPVEPVADGRPVEFHLGGPHLPGWTPLRNHNGFASLQLDECLAVRIAD